MQKKLIIFTSLLSISIGITIFLFKRLTPKSDVPNFDSTKTVNEQNIQGIVTNQWYSSLYFEEWSQPLFALPLVYKLEKDGLVLSYPQLVGSQKTIFASFVPNLTIKTKQPFIKKEVLNADPTSIKISVCNGSECFSTRFIHGSPILNLKAETEINFTIEQNAQLSQIEHGFTIQSANATYLLAVKDENNQFLDQIIQQENQSLIIKLLPQQTLIIALKPDNSDLSLTDCLSEITGTSFTYTNNNSQLISTLNYYHKDKQKPLLALLPHQWDGLTATSLGTYHSIRGDLKLYKTDQIIQEFETPEVLSIEKMLKNLNEDEKSILAKKIVTNAKQLQEDKGDDIDVIYEAGKRIFRLAQLYEIAQNLNIKETEILDNLLKQRLTKWLANPINSPNSLFVYSATPQGIIAKNPQFYNEYFNDHHFHYGYFLASAGIYLKYHPNFYSKIQPGLDLLIKDVANTDINNGYPFLRGFDVYESHSWADGRALAGDGNNQESTSEAINRWYGIYRLGDAIKDDNLINLGLTGLSMEQEAAQIYWLGQKPELFKFPEEYHYPIVSLLWGGKADYATWFSALDSHIFGIQFLPMTPAMTHIVNPTTFAKYQLYQPSQNKEAWNDIYYMVAAANGEKVPFELEKYESGNTSSFYYMWVKYWSKIYSN